MKDAPDTIRIELRVEAVRMEDDIWMQGALVIRINSEDPYTRDYIVDAAELLKSLEKDGTYFPFSCSCGFPGCAGWERGIEVVHSNGFVSWTDHDHQYSWQFEKSRIETDLQAAKKEAQLFREYFEQKGIQYVGFGYNG